MGRWAWTPDPTRPHSHLLAEKDRDPVAILSTDLSGEWRFQLTPASEHWLSAVPKSAANALTKAMAETHRSPAAAAESAERALAVLAIAAGAAPDPDHIPISFMLGLTRSSLNYLKELEDETRNYLSQHPRFQLTETPEQTEQMLSAFAPGMIAKSDRPGARKTPNPVAQARILHSMFRMPKGHWPPRNDVIDDCIYLDSRYLGNQLEKAAQLAFPPDPVPDPRQQVLQI